MIKKFIKYVVRVSNCKKSQGIHACMWGKGICQYINQNNKQTNKQTKKLQDHIDTNRE